MLWERQYELYSENLRHYLPANRCSAWWISEKDTEAEAISIFDSRLKIEAISD